MAKFFILFEFLALAVATVRYPYLKESVFKYFLPYLIVIVLYELGSIYALFAINHSNHWISNIVTTFEFVFYMLVLHSLVSVKRTLVYILSVALIITLVNILFVQGLWKLHSYTFLLQYVILVYFVCLYFYELLKSATHTMAIYKLPPFWLATGLLFSCLGQIPFYAMFDYMVYRENYEYLLLFRTITNVSNIILYSCLTISFLCFNKTRKSFP